MLMGPLCLPAAIACKLLAVTQQSVAQPRIRSRFAAGAFRAFERMMLDVHLLPGKFGHSKNCCCCC